MLTFSIDNAVISWLGRNENFWEIWLLRFQPSYSLGRSEKTIDITIILFLILSAYSYIVTWLRKHKKEKIEHFYSISQQQDIICEIDYLNAALIDFQATLFYLLVHIAVVEDTT